MSNKNSFDAEQDEPYIPNEILYDIIFHIDLKDLNRYCSTPYINEINQNTINTLNNLGMILSTPPQQTFTPITTPPPNQENYENISKVAPFDNYWTPNPKFVPTSNPMVFVPKPECNEFI